MFVVLDVAFDTEEVAAAERDGVRVVNLPLLRRSERPVPTFPYGPEVPFEVRSRKRGWHTVAWYADDRRTAMLCGKTYVTDGKSDFETVLSGDSRATDLYVQCRECSRLHQEILMRRYYAWRRAGEIPSHAQRRLEAFLATV